MKSNHNFERWFRHFLKDKIYTFAFVRLFRKILYPLSLIYGLVVRTRNFLFDSGFLASTSFSTPTICIGNLSVGGTGKTPMAEFLIDMLQNDYKIALLSRGYRRKSSGFVMAKPDSTVAELGDEPFQIHSKFPKVRVAVDADRRRGIGMLENKITPEIILLDDAYQHRRVEYEFYILLTAYGNLYVDDDYLPTGNLRDSKREAQRANIIVVTKCPVDLSKKKRDAIVKRLKPKEQQKVLFSFLEYDSQLRKNRNLLESSSITQKNSSNKTFSEEEDSSRLLKAKKVSEDEFSSRNTVKDMSADEPLSLDALLDKKVTLVTGIANPEPLVAYLKENGLIFEHLRFQDHHHFSELELVELQKKQFVLTTEKDYVRLQGKVNRAYYLPVRHRFFDDGRHIVQKQLQEFLDAGS